MIRDIEHLAALALREAESRPDVLYHGPPGEGCSYTEGTCSDGSVGCIFGQVIFSYGSAEQQEYLAASHRTSIKKVVEAMFGNCRRELAAFCEDIQDAQDGGLAWGDALSEARVALDGHDLAQLKGVPL